MGLGIRNKNRIKFNDFGDEINGYLEITDMDLFDALHQLGYNFLFTYVANKRQKQYCILHEPLSLCNSDKKRDVGFFTWLNRDGDEFLCENRLEEVYLREVLYPNSPDEMEMEECRVRFLNVFFIILVRIITYNYCKYIKHADCELPVT